MDFLTDNDLLDHSHQRFVTDSIADHAAAKDNAETQAIALIRSKLNARYDVDAIFQATGPDRHPLIVRACAMMVLHDLFARNAARKVPEDVQTAYRWAMKWLDDVRDRNENPDGLPELTSETGEPSADILYGSTSNENHFL